MNMMTVWLPPCRGKGAFVKSTGVQWNVPWDPQGSTFFQQIELFELLSFKGSVGIFAALFFCPLHCLSSVHGFPYEALPFVYRLESSVFIVALLGGVLEWSQICLHRWRKFSMYWEVRGVCPRVFLCCCLRCVDIAVPLYCFLFGPVELGGHPCSRLLLLKGLVTHFWGTHGTTAGLPHHFGLSPSTDCKINLGNRDPCWHPWMHLRSFVLS